MTSSGSFEMYFSISWSPASPCSISAMSAAKSSSRDKWATIPAPIASPRTFTVVRKRSLKVRQEGVFQLSLFELLNDSNTVTKSRCLVYCNKTKRRPFTKKIIVRDCAKNLTKINHKFKPFILSQTIPVKMKKTMLH